MDAMFHESFVLWWNVIKKNFLMQWNVSFFVPEISIMQYIAFIYEFFVNILSERKFSHLWVVIFMHNDIIYKVQFWQFELINMKS